MEGFLDTSLTDLIDFTFLNFMGDPNGPPLLAKDGDGGTNVLLAGVVGVLFMDSNDILE